MFNGKTVPVPDITKLNGRIKAIFIIGAVFIAAIFVVPYLVTNNPFLNEQYERISSLKGDFFSPQGLNQMGAEYAEQASNENGEETDAMFGESDETGSQEPLDESSTNTRNPIMPSGNDQSPAPGGEAQTEEPTFAPNKFDDSTFEILFSNPDEYVGYDASLSGKIYFASSDSTYLTLRMYNKPDVDETYRSAIFLQASNEMISQNNFEPGNCVSIDGIVRGSLPDTNSLGNKIKVPIIDAVGVQEITCIDQSLPAEMTAWPNESQTVNGITMTVETLQFSKDHTRILISVINEKTSNVYLRDSESFAKQGETTYQIITGDSRYDNYKIDQVITPETETKGHLFFEPIADSDQTISFNIVLEEVKVSGNTKSVFIITV